MGVPRFGISDKEYHDTVTTEDNGKITCPKCRHVQESAEWCAYCGLVFGEPGNGGGEGNFSAHSDDPDPENWVEAVKRGIEESRVQDRRRRRIITVRVALVLLFLALIGGGVVTGCRGVERHRQASSRTWPTVEGKVVFSQVKTEVAFRFGHESELGRNHTDLNTYTIRPAIAYRYAVKDTTYTGTTVSFAPRYGEAYSREIVSRYPLSSRCTVYYDPDAPSSAVLMPGLPGYSGWDATARVTGGLLMAAAGIGGIVRKRSVFAALGLSLTDDCGNII